MAKTFDFNAIQRPTLRVVLGDDARTALNVTTPAEAMIEKLMASADTLGTLKDSQSVETIRAVYAFGAEVISYNLEGVTVTAEELRDKYKVNLYGLIAFFSAYVEFIKGISDEKN